MAVCKFFQQGYCRYGQNCRFEHIYGSKYSYHANAPAQAPPQVVAPTGVTDEQLVNQVQTDIQAALRGGQWILSCYSPFKEKPIFPGINDLSTEEARLFIYEAKAKNQVEQAVLYMNNLYQEARQKYEQLLQPNMAIINVLRCLYKGEIVPSPFSEPPNSFGNASSVFRSAVQSAPSHTPSVFQQNNVFNSQDTAKSIFSSAVSNVQPTQNQNVFAQNQPTPQSIFASAVNNISNPNQNNPASVFASANQNIFAKEPSQNTNNSPFNQTNSAFSQNNSPFTQTNSAFNQNTSPFSQNNSPFSQNNTAAPGNVFQSNTGSVFGAPSVPNANDYGVYSKMEELSQEDLVAFNSNSFILGAVPEIAPPYELCINKGQF